jgi:hypothetical protein
MLNTDNLVPFLVGTLSILSAVVGLLAFFIFKNRIWREEHKILNYKVSYDQLKSIKDLYEQFLRVNTTEQVAKHSPEFLTTCTPTMHIAKEEKLYYQKELFNRRTSLHVYHMDADQTIIDCLAEEMAKSLNTNISNLEEKRPLEMTNESR